MSTPYEDIGYTVPDRSRRGAAASEDPEGATPSNRAPDSCKPFTFEVCSRHVDSLELSYLGTLKAGIEEQFDQLKKLAQSKDLAKQALAQIVVGDETFAVLAKGGRFFDFTLQSSNFFIRLAQRLNDKGLPCATCQIRSDYLLAHGPLQAQTALTHLLSEITELSEEPTVSRIDLAVDFASDIDMGQWPRHAWVTRIRKKTGHVDGELFTGYMIGTHRNPMLFRLYDKTHESRENIGKTLIHDIWKLNGHVPFDTVLRAEGQFRREALNRFGLKHLRDVLASLNALWQYLTTDVVRLTLPEEGDNTRARWKCHPLWERLQGVVWDGNQPLVRKPVPNGAPSDMYYARQYNSLIASVMGRENIQEPEEAENRIRGIAIQALESKEEFSGLSPKEALRIRAMANGRRYCTMRNVEASVAPPAPSTPDGHDYRRASKGG